MLCERCNEEIKAEKPKLLCSNCKNIVKKKHHVLNDGLCNKCHGEKITREILDNEGIVVAGGWDPSDYEY